MVKIPGLDNLKKIGSDLIDSAKTVHINDVVNKIKTGIESVTKKNDVGHAGQHVADDNSLVKLLEDMNTVLNELEATNTAQVSAIKQMQEQVAEMMDVAVTFQKAG